MAAYLVKDLNLPVFAIKGEDSETYYAHIQKALAHLSEPDHGRWSGSRFFLSLHRPGKMGRTFSSVRKWAEAPSQQKRKEMIEGLIGGNRGDDHRCDSTPLHGEERGA